MIGNVAHPKETAMLTYRQLADWIKQMPAEKRGMNATLYTTDDEFYPISAFSVQRSDDILDEGHPYMVIPVDGAEPLLTHQQILDWIEKMPVENFDTTAAVRTDADEWVPVVSTAVQEGDDVLDDGHPYMVAGILIKEKETGFLEMCQAMRQCLDHRPERTRP